MVRPAVTRSDKMTILMLGKCMLRGGEIRICRKNWRKTALKDVPRTAIENST
jgi:hypothetical protein